MTTDKQQRKERPIARGVLDYFPDAIAEVANVSYVGNQQHNPGQEMHWSRGKSADHADCIARHLIERGTLDTDGLRHSAKTAWRALAMLQIEIEDAVKDGAPISAGETLVFGEKITNDWKVIEPAQVLLAAALETEGKPGPARVTTQKFFDRPERERDFKELIRLGCPDQVARQIVLGTTYSGCEDRDVPGKTPYAYVAGPMRGLPQFNFPAFDVARDELVKQGYNVISPADIDRAAEFDPPINARQHGADHGDQRDYCFRDFWALYFIAQINQKTSAIVMLRNYERSVGATAEYGIAKWLGLNLREFDRDFPPKIEAEKFYTPRNAPEHRYRIRHGVVEYDMHRDDRWEPSNDYRVPEAFHTAIQKGELIPCEPSSSATSTNPSATPATSASAKTCATPTNART